MDDPGSAVSLPHFVPRLTSSTVAEIPAIIHTLCRASPADQQTALETYFTPTASFTHPFCRTGSGPYSRWLIKQIYRWYKILSPYIDISIYSVGMLNSYNAHLYKRR